MTDLPELKDGYTWSLWVSDPDPKTGNRDILLGITSDDISLPYPDVFQEVSRKYSDARTAILVTTQELLGKHPRLFKDHTYTRDDIISAWSELMKEKDSK